MFVANRPCMLRHRLRCLLLTAFWLGLKVNFGYAQTIRDFFQPVAGRNVAKFQWPESKSKTPKGRIYRTVLYARQHDTVAVVDVRTFEDFASGHTVPTGSSSLICRYSGNKVLLFNSTVTNLYGQTERKKYDTSPVLLMLPAAGKVAKWSYVSISQEPWNCSATLTAITYKGKPRQAIRVVKRSHNYPGVTEVLFYLKGVGLYQRFLIDESGILPQESLGTLEWDAGFNDELQERMRQAVLPPPPPIDDGLYDATPQKEDE